MEIFLNYKTSLALIDRCLKSNFVWNVFKLFSYFIARKCWKQMYFSCFYVSVALDRSTRRKTLRSSGNSDQNETLLLIRQDYLSL